MTSCASLYRPVPLTPFSDQEVINLVSRMQDQGKRVSSFYSHGLLLVRESDQELEFNILIAATREPFRIKIEITHPWGRPVFHILIDETRLDILSFPEKRLYSGTFSPQALARFFPGDLSSDLIWSALRGYPDLLAHGRLSSLKPNQITLFKEKEVVEIIDFDPASLCPTQASFPERNIHLAFSDFEQRDGTYYARKVEVTSFEGRRDLELRNKEIVFNSTIPQGIFALAKPPSFETFHLQENH